MEQKIKIWLLALVAMTSVSSAWGQVQAIKQWTLNTATAVSGELAYQAGADSIYDDKQISVVHATFRYMMKSKDMATREGILNFQNRMVYKMLVNECNGFIRDMNEMMDAARQHPEHMAGCITSGTEMLLQAYSLVKHVVVVAMNSKVPLPWKVDYYDFLEGKDNTPKYENDPDRTEEETDKANLLLPTERFKITINAIVQLSYMRTAIRAVTSKLKVDFTWQKAVEYAVNFDSYIHEAQRRAFDTFGTNIAARPLP